ncbi:MAG: proprotein convertase P-domain-containing protein [Phycisphaerae bacterium]|nr:proprotein convertase P-domain-containing protein [Phycisphaerae bacterium]
MKRNRGLLGLCSGLLLAASALAQPANDLCAGAIDVSSGPFPFLTTPVDITSATVTGDPTFSCQTSRSRTIWYKITPAASGTMRIATCPADAPLNTVSDTIVAVYTGACGGTFSQIGCNDDSCGLRSNLSVTVAAGTEYWILTGKFGTAAPGTTTRDLQLYINPPTNLPTPPTGVGSVSPTSVNNCGDQTVLVSVLVTPGANPASTGIVVEADLSAIGGSGTQALNDLGVDGDVTPGDGRYSFRQTVADTSTTGAKSFPFIVSDAEMRSSNGTITGLTVTACPPPPMANNTCGSAEPIVVDQRVEGYTTSRGDTSTVSCGSATTGRGVWYLITGTGNTMTATTCDSFTNHDTIVGVFCGADGCSMLTCIGANDDATCSFSGLHSRFSWCSVAGRPYYIFVRGFSTATGNFALTVSDDGTPCTTALPCGDPTPPTGVGSAAPTSVQNCGDQTSLLSVLVTGGRFPNSTDIMVECDLSSIGGSSNQAFNDLGLDGDVTPGDGRYSYLATIADTTTVGAKTLMFTVSDAEMRSSMGNITLNVTQCPPPPPANDNCAGAEDFNLGDIIAGYITTRSAASTNQPECPPVSSNQRLSWYKVTGTGNTMTVSTDHAGTTMDTIVAVYCGIRGCAGLFCIGGDDDGGTGLTSLFTFCSEVGSEYYVVVGGFGGGTGNYEVSITDNGDPCQSVLRCVFTGACCLPEEQTCAIMSEAECFDMGGTYLGNDSACETVGDFGAPIESTDNFPIAIPDFSGGVPGTASSSLTVATGETVGALQVCVGLTHTFAADLIVSVSNGIHTAVLMNREGGGRNPSGVYCFNDFATATIGGSIGDPIPAGTYRSNQSLSVFTGDPADGTWTLTVTDNAGIDVGTIDSFSVQSAPITPNCSYCPACAADFNQDGGIDGADVEAFYFAWENALPCSDVNQDGGIEGADVDFFFEKWEAGGCF